MSGFPQKDPGIKPGRTVGKQICEINADAFSRLFGLVGVRIAVHDMRPATDERCLVVEGQTGTFAKIGFQAIIEPDQADYLAAALRRTNPL